MRGSAWRAAGPIFGLAFLLGSAQAQDGAGRGAERLSGIRVDVQPLLAQGGGAPAVDLREDLLAALRTEFADRLGGAGPVLVVRIKGLSINPYVGSGGGRGRFGGGTQSDYLDGEALLVGRRGEVLLRHPQLSVTPSSSGGAWYDAESERRRITALAEHYAGWLRRALPKD